MTLPCTDDFVKEEVLFAAIGLSHPRLPWTVATSRPWIFLAA
jgi:hypothetical protein